jgi:hypothetical protein
MTMSGLESARRNALRAENQSQRDKHTFAAVRANASEQACWDFWHSKMRPYVIDSFQRGHN